MTAEFTKPSNTLPKALFLLFGLFIGVICSICIGVIALWVLKEPFNFDSNSNVIVCTYDGTEYQDGDTFNASDGCNLCGCNEGVVFCTEMDCSADRYSLDDNVVSYPKSEVWMSNAYLSKIVEEITKDDTYDWSTDSILLANSDVSDQLFCGANDIVSDTSDGREADPSNDILILNLEDPDENSVSLLERSIISYLNDNNWELCRLEPNSGGGAGIYYKNGEFLYLDIFSSVFNDSYSLAVGIEY